MKPNCIQCIYQFIYNQIKYEYVLNNIKVKIKEEKMIFGNFTINFMIKYIYIASKEKNLQVNNQTIQMVQNH